ncbi:MAG: carboxylating nicotinate-nucleotide diphosphorylase [Eubacteriales bacterium]|nr:carboxylating nicotinate-nucleotide diphosphorylase [Eubacteriales bacterium]
MTNLNFNASVDRLIETALEEDIGTGDITTACCIPVGSTAYGRFLAKEEGVVCGLDVARRVFLRVDPNTKFTARKKDGDRVSLREIIAEVSGDAHSLLTAERVALNLMQRMSGIATRTAEAVKAVAGTHARICDTRKSTPGMRVLEKYAVRVGGGSNHRFNLADGILIKDNHIVAAGGITAAVRAAKANAPHTLKIEVETENEEQIREALSAGADIIMLDNMTVPQMADAVRLIAGRAVTEASGNMGDRDLAEVASTGVDLISIGALTHSVRSLDISLKFKIEGSENL